MTLPPTQTSSCTNAKRRQTPHPLAAAGVVVGIEASIKEPSPHWFGYWHEAQTFKRLVLDLSEDSGTTLLSVLRERWIWWCSHPLPLLDFALVVAPDMLE